MVPRASDEALISAFIDGVKDLKMKEDLAMNDELCSALEMFNLPNRCAKAEEGRLSLREPPAVEPEEKKTKAKEAKRKAPAVLAAEPETKRSRGEEPP